MVGLSNVVVEVLPVAERTENNLGYRVLGPATLTTATRRSNVATVGITATEPAGETETIKYPEWVNDFPQMAWSIADSDVIARAKLVSIEPVTYKGGLSDTKNEVALDFAFRIVEYLKGEGGDGLVITLRYRQLSDVISVYTEEEAQRLANNWLTRNEPVFYGKESGILFLKDWNRRTEHDGRISRGRYQFTRLTYWEWDATPIVGATWLPEIGEATYEYQPLNDESNVFSLEEISSRIWDIEQLLKGEYGLCVSRSLVARSLVRSKILDAHWVPYPLGGYFQAEPFLQGRVPSSWRPFSSSVLARQSSILLASIQQLRS